MIKTKIGGAPPGPPLCRGSLQPDGQDWQSEARRRRPPRQLDLKVGFLLYYYRHFCHFLA